MRSGKSGVDRIEDIELFVRVVERGSLTAAAAATGLSVSLVSRRLSDLERNLGVRLVDRSSRMLVLTESGREFHAHAETILHAVREAELALLSKADELRGTLRISLPTVAVEIGVLADFVALFRRHPALTIELHLSDRPVDIVAHGFDAAVYLSDAPDRHPGDVVIGQHPTALAAAPGYLDQVGRPSSPQELLEHRTVRAVSVRGSATEWLLIHEDGRELTLPPSGGMLLSTDLRILTSAVISGLGIGRMPLGFLAPAARAGELEQVLPQWRFRPVMTCATLRRGGGRSSKVTALLELVIGALQRINAIADSWQLDEEQRELAASGRLGLATDSVDGDEVPAPPKPVKPAGRGRERAR
ncbi:MAG: LysR family transcriptional regulator [Xanthomonadales bacterium]|nr:LysR family transcriptional regulator [Xanthomonadales bacterium]